MSKRTAYQILLCLFAMAPAISNAQQYYSQRYYSQQYYSQQYYAPSKVVYDVSSSDTSELSHILDRASLLQKIYHNDSFDASIILVVHEGAIPLFVKNNKIQHELMQRVKSLTLGEIIQIRVCEASANMQGFYKDDFDSFIQIVPMADAEIIELQNNGYAYLKWSWLLPETLLLKVLLYKRQTLSEWYGTWTDPMKDCEAVSNDNCY